MITYDPKTKTIHMCLIDLEHCGFDHGEFEEELWIDGLDSTDKNILWPDALIVTFADGAIMTLTDKSTPIQPPSQTAGGESHNE